MKTASDVTKERIQYDYAGGAVSKPIIKTEYYSDTSSQWVEFDSDIESRSISLSNENKRYQNYSFLPPSKELNMRLNNFGQVYSTGSGHAKASILKKNLLIRCWSGYEFNTYTDADNADDYSTDTKFVHTQKSGSTVILDNIYSGTVATAAELGSLYGTAVYGSAVYAYPGYYTKTFNKTERMVRFEVDTNKANNFSYKHRFSQYSDFHDAAWSSYQALATGANSIALHPDQDDEYYQFIVRFEDNVWNTHSKIENINLVTQDRRVFLQQGVFIVDDPKLTDTKVNVIGRDYLRKALETEINMPVLSSENIASAITKVLDRCSIPYDTSSWDTTGTTVSLNNTLADDLSNESGWKVLDYLLDAQNAGDDDWIFRFNQDGEPELKKVPTDAEADWSVHYHYNIESITKGEDSEKQLQRVTVLNKDIPVNAETLLATSTGTTSASLHITYNQALYVRYEDDNDVITAETLRGNTGVTFTTNSGASYTIRVYGCRPRNALTDEVYAEAGNSDNILNNRGSTYKRINPFMNSNMVYPFASYVLGKNQDPQKRAEVLLNPNPLIELNDKLMIFDLYTYTDDIYVLNEIRESWNNPGLKHRLILRDSGIDLGLFQWDRNGVNEGINDLKYDTGFVWDQDLEIGGSDTATYYPKVRLTA